MVPKYRVAFFDSLELKGYNLTVYASKKNEKGLTSEELNYNDFDYSLGFYNILGVVFFQSFYRYIKGLKSGDVIILSGNPRLASNYIVLLIAKMLGVKVICWSHGWSAGKHGLSAKIRHLIMRAYHSALLYTEKEVDEFLKNKILDKDHLYFLNNGIEFDPEIHRYGKQRCFNLDNSTKNILFIGRLTEKSNLLLLLESMKLLDQTYRLVVIGEGALMNTAKSFIIENKLENIEFVGSVYNDSDLISYFEISDLFVYPGNVGLSLLHSFAFGLPAVLHSNVKNHQPEFAASSPKNSIYFDENDFNSLANAIESYFGLSRDDKISMSKNSYLTVKEKYNTKKMAENFEKMIDSLVSK
ncbi:hypothetical protein AT00_17130 [Pseudoalteromonas lipolytica SCSIO 04301]|nr:hypothetical protein AT00_17130 [Pseudoalteromonas lipolytica SCSIO 04301]